MYGFKALQSLVFGYQEDPLCKTLRASDVPVTTADCRACADPCDLEEKLTWLALHAGHEAYPRRFDIDMDTQMLGSVKPYHRQVVISTGKSDWERDITDDKLSLAAAIGEVVSGLSPKSPKLPASPKPASPVPTKGVRPVNGLFNTSDSSRISVLNGSHRTVCHEDAHESVLVFPDFKVVTEVPRSVQGALELWESAIDPSIGRDGSYLEKSILKTWVLPYSCVILLSFIKSLEAHGWDADTQLEHPQLTMGLPLEDLNVTPEERDENVEAQLKQSLDSKRALILKVSHIGGHKYAGNAIIYTPSGSGVWYGRVTPHDVDSIVTNTIINGLILPPLLRGGLNLSRPNCQTLNDW
ncbi:Altered inheritance of mitochondria protein 32 [Psilocybe cubensis]|uniref:Altered inheritance of mitochondria protein 32 n=1 Tax=Psilocybe cubensis TaxID=181762 RepID=A0ACB8H4H2_PSICU|nr:Altered inheritance of mitochondria protein 32 [Psilocybe cubensis]KAH9482609.1 Altered inheritance of mitochondria protein 32 [Psilocybe cubensis]